MTKVAEKEGVELLLENEGSCNIATSQELANFLKMVPSKALGINWDPLNGTSLKEIPFPDGYRLLPKKRIGNVQIKGRSILDGPQKLDWPAIFRALEKDGYRGHVGLETHIFGPEQVQKSHESMREILRIVEPS
jgi:sugar phosphate isomerase/epimerase